MAEHQFGGPWTEQKLKALRAYLVEYQKIFKRNPRASYYKTIYVDAFAGTGERDSGEDDSQAELFGYDEDTRKYQEGSVKIALALEDKFDRYVFLDKKRSHVSQLREVVQSEFPALRDRCLVEQAEANEWLRTWCSSEDWKKHRAVVFLDPYGMSVEWATLEAIAGTKAIDLWVLFPLGIGPTRVLPANALPEARWANRLTKLFGTEDWVRFYRREPKSDLFNGHEEAWNRDASVQNILQFFLERMAGIFARVVERPLILMNSKNSPMYALCFAAGNERGAKTAVRIAAYITRN